MKLATQLFTIFCVLAGCIGLVRLSTDNGRLEDQVHRLEAELGRMSIGDSDRVHLVEIETPDVPPEVASHVERVWQFRCYLPPGYDVTRMSGGGRVTERGIYHQGGFGSSWNSPNAEPEHRLLTISVQQIDGCVQTLTSFGGSSGSSSWNRIDPKSLTDRLVVKKLVSVNSGPRSLDPPHGGFAERRVSLRCLP